MQHTPENERSANVKYTPPMIKADSHYLIPKLYNNCSAIALIVWKMLFATIVLGCAVVFVMRPIYNNETVSFRTLDTKNTQSVPYTGFLNDTELVIPRLQRLTRQLLNYGPRWTGSPGYLQAQAFLISQFEALSNWQVERDTFTDSTPIGQLEFTNIIANYVPLANSSTENRKRVIFAAHYESRYVTSYEFLGATDSALPTILLLELARYISAAYPPASLSQYDIQIVLFDGEEAFVRWQGTDNTYGSRHLAAKWEREGKLSNIDHFVLLDLLGAGSPSFWNFFPAQTGSQWSLFQSIEQNLRQNGSLTTTRTMFGGTASSTIEDDHIPFLQRGVKILHIIPVPFPSVWHTANDKYEALHWPTISDLDSILKTYVARYFEIPAPEPSPFISAATASGRGVSARFFLGSAVRALVQPIKAIFTSFTVWRSN